MQCCVKDKSVVDDFAIDIDEIHLQPASQDLILSQWVLRHSSIFHDGNILPTS